MKSLLALVSLIYLAVVSEASVGCDICIGLAAGLEKAINDGEQADIDEANKICDKLTKGKEVLDVLCISIVDNSIKYIVDAINHEETPQKVCEQIRICK
ncbi:hypothetical protein QR680_010681 [Steinernema hermaphroditum]|uniref:Saposin B-type domain-containing protein n=1 Tax=Steinernema hermaphroditum TaxID=289476 RepID=A0AA39IRK5_9BILA|nr:hypothetical protein QR680_010681 [Steinernema hermaphroditum]